MNRPSHNQFRQFLNEHKIESGNQHHIGTTNYTHVSMSEDAPGKYQFSVDKMEKFWQLYCDNILAENYSFSLAEKPSVNLPVLVDLDLKIPYPGEVDDDEETKEKHLEHHLYTKEEIEQLVQIYYEAFGQIQGWQNKFNYCCVMEKKPTIKEQSGKLYKSSGLHLSFPYVWLDRHGHEHILSRIKARLARTRLFMDVVSSLNLKNAGDTVDCGYLKTAWLLYGSKKSSNGQPYLLSYILDENCMEVSMEKAFEKYRIYDANELEIDMNKNYRYYLPRILSTNLWGRKLWSIREDIEELHRLVPQSGSRYGSEQRQRLISQHCTTDDMKQAKIFIKLLNPSRADNRDEWLYVGFTLYNISTGNEGGLQMWIEFSEQSQKFASDAECISIWSGMKLTNLTIGSLKYMAKQDNPVKYKEEQSKLVQDDFNEALDGSNNSIAKALKKFYGNEWVCTDYKNNEWYFFENHHWRRANSAVELRKKLSDEFITIINTKVSEFDDQYKKLDSTKSDYERRAKDITEKIDSCHTLKTNLKDNTFKNKVMNEAKEVFSDENFVRRLNTNENIICCKNGIYDFKLQTLRSGRPEDYISLQMPVDYIEYTEDSPEVLQVKKFFQEVFPDSEIHNFMLRILSEIISRAGNFRKHIYIWKGIGHNGKSVLQSFLDQLLGDYTIKFPTALVTNKRTQSSSASPELERAGFGVRLATIVEPSKSERFNVGILKELTGNDMMYVRGLFKEGKDIVPHFKLNIICNNLPKILDGDTAIWNRIRIIPFESTFVLEGAPENREEQIRQKIFPMDLTFGAKIPHMLRAFLWILINQFKKNGEYYYEPEPVVAASKDYQDKNSVYATFFNSEIEKALPSSLLTFKEVQTKFAHWFKINYPGDPMDKSSDMKEEFEKLMGATIRNVFYGYKLKEEVINHSNAIAFHRDQLPPEESMPRPLPVIRVCDELDSKIDS